MRTRSTRTRLVTVAAAAALGAVALAGCGGGTEAGDAAGGSVASEAEPAVGERLAEPDQTAPEAPRAVAGAGGDTAREGSGGEVGDEAGAAYRPEVSTRAVIRRGEVSVVTPEMSRARLEIDDLLGKHGGYIASEDSSNDRAGSPERSVLVLRVPEPSFDEVMTELASVGRTRHATRSSEDVTREVVDVESRVATQEASLARLQQFLREARTVEDMIRLESEIAERQADLESLEAQQKYLRDNTAMSTVTVRLRTPDAPPPPPEPEEAGFLVGLAGGWTALKTVLVGAATVAGALLPFLVAIGLVVVPLALVARAARRRRTPAGAVAPAAPDAG